MLTDVGERVVRIFRKIFFNYEKFDQEIAREKGLEVGIVRIGAIPVAAASFCPKSLAISPSPIRIFNFRSWKGSSHNRQRGEPYHR
jgi:hypothetical protein